MYLKKKVNNKKIIFENLSNDEILNVLKNWNNYDKKTLRNYYKTARERKILTFEHETLRDYIWPNAKNYHNTGNFLSRGLVIFLIGGIGLMSVAISDTIIGIQTLFWKETTAVITIAEKERDGLYDDGSEKYNYTVEYEYTVDGVVYQNNRMTFRTRDDKDSFANFIYYYENTGKIIKIKHEPNDPQYSVVYGYSIIETLLIFFAGMGLYSLFLMGCRKADEEFYDYDIVRTKKSVIILSVVLGIIIFLAVFNLT